MAVGRELQPRRGAADFALAGEKDEDAAVGFASGLFDQAGGGVFEPVLFGKWAVKPAGFDRIGATLGGDDRHVAHEARDRFGVERCGHGQKDQVIAQGVGNLEAEGKAEIGIEGTFVEFVKQHRADAGKFGVGLDHPGEDAFGDDLDAGLGGGLALAAHAVADGLARFFAQGLGHALGGGAGGEAAGFEHENPAGNQSGLKQGQRHHGRLARAGGRLQHGAAPRL